MRIKFLFCILLTFLIFHTSWSQQNANNPLSSFGIGEFSNGNNPIYSAMGNTYSTQIDSFSVNYLNPSSYSAIAKGLPIFSIGLNNTFQISQQNGKREFGSYQTIDHFVFGIAFAKILGFSFGMMPMTRSDYHFYELEDLSKDLTMRHLYDGTGNSNLIYGGLSANVLNFKRHKLGIGVNLGYLFGTLKNTQTSYIEDGADTHKGTLYATTRYLQSFYYSLGLNYRLLLDNDYFILGATYVPQQRLQATRIFEKAYTTNVDDVDNYSYILSDQVKGKIILPNTTTIGLQYVFNSRVRETSSKLNSRISFSLEYKTTAWSNYDERFTDSLVSFKNNNKNTSTFAFGIEYIPQQMFLERVTTGYFSKIRYRAGVSYATLPQVINNRSISRQTYSVGFGFPFTILRSTSSVNFAFSYGHQTQTMLPDYHERFFTLSLGISFAPGFNDKWFRKYKID